VSLWKRPYWTIGAGGGGGNCLAFGGGRERGCRGGVVENAVIGGKLRGGDPERVDVLIGGGGFSVDGGGGARAEADVPGRKCGRGYSALGAGCADDKRSVFQRLKA
jgi:hypothetical protein